MTEKSKLPQLSLSQIYAQALDGWAISLCTLLLIELLIPPPHPLANIIVASLVMLASVYRSWQHPRNNLGYWFSIAVLLVAQFSLVKFSIPRIVGFAIATLLAFIQTQKLQHIFAAIVTVGFSLCLIAALLWEAPFIANWDWLVVGAIATLVLWLFGSYLSRKSALLKQIYARAVNFWGIALCGLELILLTCHALGIYGGLQNDYNLDLSPAIQTAIAALILSVALVFTNWISPSPWKIYSLGWALELVTTEVLGLTGRSVIDVAIANIVLGLFIQLIGEWWYRQNPSDRVFPSLHILPLIYAGLAGCLRWGTFTNWTGLSTLGIALIVIGIGRRKTEFKPLTYLGIVGISVAAYELLIYQLLQQSAGGGIGDALIAIATLGTTILYAYTVLFPWLLHYLKLTPQELKNVTHAHWIWSSLILLTASFQPIESGMLLGFGTGAFLVQYAILQGRNQPNPQASEYWVYLGFLEAIALRIYWLNTPIAQLLGGPLVPWKIAIASIFSYFLYLLPWQSWGWSKKPWKVAAFAIPLIAILEKPAQFYPLSFLFAAIFYIFLAWDNRNIRFTYITVGIFVWICLGQFPIWELNDPVFYVTPLGLFLLYIAQVDPALRQPHKKTTRHFLRIFGSGIICTVALLAQSGNGLVPAVFGLIAVGGGLALRVRAFLFIGTLTFVLQVFYQLVVLIFDYPFIKWVIGLAVGITLIWIAATFETRREQIGYLVRRWISQLQEWE